MYSVEYDLIHDIERRGRNVLEVFRELLAAGEILDCEVNFEAVGTLDDPIGKQLPLGLILATASKPDDIGPLFPHNRDKVKLLSGPSARLPEATEAPTVTAAPTTIAPPPQRSPVPEIHPKVAPPAQAEHPAPVTAAAKPVKTNLDRLGGKVEIVSVLGKGTSFRIKLPLTLAIISSLIVSVEGERFAIPQINVEELLRVQPGKTKTRIEIVGETEVLVLRDQLIQLVRFADLVGVLPTYIDPNTANRREIDRRERLADRRSPRHPAILGEAQKTAAPAGGPSPRDSDERRESAASALEIAVVTTGTQTYGLVVGAFHDTEEIVVKPLGSHLKGLREYAGATILGDGTVALILDIAGLAAKAELGVVSGTERARQQSQAAEQERLTDTHALLLFHNGTDQLCAVPLDTVLRIERIRPEQVETMGGRRTMQHRGGFLPLITLSDTAQVDPIGDAKELAVMISNIRGHEVGLLGAMPVDVIETNAAIDQVTHRQKGVAGSAIIRDRTAFIVDLFELVDATWPEWAEQHAAENPPSPGAEGSVVLLAEDSNFFRAQVTRFIEEDGYTVLAAPDGEAAWDLLVENVGRVKAVVTDIEMPRLDGLGLTRRIRADERTAGLPIIALTSLASDEDFARGEAVGVSEYQTKLDRDNLLAGLQRLMAADAASYLQAN